MRIISGGQTGADRAALEVAKSLGLPYGGWVPKDGWAEDLTAPPGLLRDYPAMRETGTNDPAERTRRNVWDSAATLILITEAGQAVSFGTVVAEEAAMKARRPCLIVRVDHADAANKVSDWLLKLDGVNVLNVAGPRESEAPGLYEKAVQVLRTVLSSLK